MSPDLLSQVLDQLVTPNPLFTNYELVKVLSVAWRDA